MKRPGMGMVLGVVCSVGWPSLSVPAEGTSPPRTVVDYYLLLPRDRYFEWDTEADLRRIIQPASRGITDIPHGYLQTMGDGAQARITVRIFKHADGTHLVAVSANRASDGVWEPWIHFYRYRDGKLADVTAELQPAPVEPPLGFTLPREGIAIHVVEKPGRRYYCGKKSYVVEVPGKVRHKWFWTGTGFQVRPGTAGPTSAAPSPREAASR